MPQSLHKTSIKLQRVQLAVLGVTAVLAVLVAGRVWASIRNVDTPSPSVNTRAAVTSLPQGGPRIETELVTVLRTGFEPLEISRPRGPFFLEVDNRSEGDVNLRLERLGHERLKARALLTTAPEWQEELNLPPGDYVLSDANHPDWTCRITITPN